MQTQPSLLAQLQTIIDQVLKTQPVLTTDSRAADVPGWDSYATVEIIFLVEDHFGFRMTSAEMERVDGIGSLIAMVQNHCNIPAA